jgi:hypothetical protein
MLTQVKTQWPSLLAWCFDPNCDLWRNCKLRYAAAQVRFTKTSCQHYMWCNSNVGVDQDGSAKTLYQQHQTSRELITVPTAAKSSESKCLACLALPKFPSLLLLTVKIPSSLFYLQNKTWMLSTPKRVIFRWSPTCIARSKSRNKSLG